MPYGMTSLEWSQAQMQNPAICQKNQAIQNKTLDTIKFNKDMSSDLKAFLRIRIETDRELLYYRVKGGLRAHIADCVCCSPL